MPTGLPNGEKARIRQPLQKAVGRADCWMQNPNPIHGPGNLPHSTATAKIPTVLMEIMGLHLPGASSSLTSEYTLCAIALTQGLQQDTRAFLSAVGFLPMITRASVARSWVS